MASSRSVRVLLLAASLSACSATSPRTLSAGGVAVHENGPGDFEITAPGHAALSLRFLSGHSFHLHPRTPDKGAAKLPELMVVKNDSAFPGVTVRAEATLSTASFTTPEGVTVQLQPGSAHGYSAKVIAGGREVISNWVVNPEAHGMSLALRANEHIYGFGDKRLAIDQHGNTVKLWNADAFASETNKSYKNVPFYSSSAGYGLFLHNFHVMNYDIGAKKKDTLKVDAEGGDMDFYVFLGSTPKDLLSQYTEITGRPAMVPRWFFGYHQGRAAPGYQADDGLRVAARMRKDKLPIDVIYYDDWDRTAINPNFVRQLRESFQVRLTLGYGMPLVGEYVGVGYDEKPLVEELKRKNLLWTNAKGEALIGPAEEVASEQPGAPNKVAYVDFFNPEAAELMFDRKFSQAIRAGALLGMADFGELANVENPKECFWPSIGLDTQVTHNLYGLAYSSALVNGSQKRTGGRSLGMVRPGIAGTQRLGWTTTGDSTPNYQNFRFHFKGAMNLALTGFSNVGYDIGGWNEHGPDDVYARWLAAGTFNPLMWSHGIKDHEPYSHGAAVENVAREFLNLRYRLIPYLYTQMEIASSTGIPILRPLALEVPRDPRSAKIEDEEFVGDNLLVAPVFNKEGDRDVYLPEGTWYDLFGELPPVTGGASILRRGVPMNRIPAYVRAGAILPLGPEMQHTGEKAVDPLELNFYAYPAGAAAKPFAYALYEDDGESTRYADGAYQFTRIEAEQAAGSFRIRVSADKTGAGFAGTPGRSYVLRVHGLPAARKVLRNGTELDSSAWSRDPSRGTVQVTIPGPASAFEVEIR